ncbi:hypothetical protein ACPEIC_40005 [Stenotrophomonas sp. NPDC087984]
MGGELDGIDETVVFLRTERAEAIRLTRRVTVDLGLPQPTIFGVAMTTSLTPHTVQRLAMVRFLFDQGVGLARRAEPLSAPAVNHFQDSVEMFLRLAADHLKVNLPNNTAFAEFWTKLEPALPGPLPSKNAMDRMNRLRVAFKHHGTVPSSTAIEQSRADVTTFLIDATTLVFSVDFERVDMIDLVKRQATVDRLRTAQAHADAKDIGAGLAGLADAFTELLDHYGRSGLPELSGPLHLGPRIEKPRRIVYQGESAFLKPYDQGLKAISAMQETLQVLAAGVDHYEYARFKALTPEVLRHTPRINRRGIVSPFHESRSVEDYEFCYRFVISTALQMAEADRVMDLMPERREYKSRAVEQSPRDRVRRVALPLPPCPPAQDC